MYNAVNFHTYLVYNSGLDASVFAVQLVYNASCSYSAACKHHTAKLMHGTLDLYQLDMYESLQHMLHATKDFKNCALTGYSMNENLYE